MPLRENALSTEETTASPKARAFKSFLRRRALILGGGALAFAAGAGVLVRGAHNGQLLPALAGASPPRAIGEGFFVVDGWVLTEEDLKRLAVQAPPPLP